MLFFKNKETKNVICKNSEMVGTLKSDKPIIIYGIFKGMIETSKEVVIADSAIVNADITAGAISLSGKLKSKIDTEEDFEIFETGTFEGEISAGRIILHRGAEINLTDFDLIAENEKK